MKIYCVPVLILFTNCLMFFENYDRIEFKSSPGLADDSIDITYRIISKNAYQRDNEGKTSPFSDFMLNKNKIFPNAKVYKHSEYMTIKKKNKFRIDLILLTEDHPKPQFARNFWLLLSLLSLGALPYVNIKDVHYTAIFYDSSGNIYPGAEYKNTVTFVIQTLLIFNFWKKKTFDLQEEFLRSVSLKFQEWSSER